MTTSAPSRLIFSGIQPTGRLTLGNYLGALHRFVDLQQHARCVFCIVNLHALTVDHDPAMLRQHSRETAALFLAAGIDPGNAILARQGDIATHTELAYLLESTAYVGELNRMIQFRQKGQGQPRTRVSLYTYPTLMAADILAYGATEVPVGADQRQHLELTSTLAERFNSTYGEVFVVPRMLQAELGARVRDLQDPATKMSKTAPDDHAGSVRLLDDPAVIRRKILRAVTDSVGVVRHAPDEQPGVANLVQILAAATGHADPVELATAYDSYGALKADTADAVVALLEPLQKRYADLIADPAELERILATGAERATELSAPYLRAAREAIGLG